MDYPGGPPRHKIVFFMQSIMAKIFYFVTNRKFRCDFIDFLSNFGMESIFVLGH
jgi:hypothetical protein